MPEDVNNASPQSAKPTENSQAKKAMREIILKWIGEGMAPAVSDLSIKETAPIRQKITVRAIEPAADKQRQAVHEALSRARSELKNQKADRVRPKSDGRSSREPELHLEQYEISLLAKRWRYASVLVWLYGAMWSVFILGTVVLVVGVYKLGWDDQLTNKLLNYVPLPYGFVRYHPIWYGTYRAEYQAISRFRSQQLFVNSQSAILSEEIENILVRRTMANDLAWGRGLWVSDREAVSELNDIVIKAGSIDEVERTVQALWGISIDEYGRRVIRPYLLKKKLLSALSNDFLIKQRFGAANDLQTLDGYLDQLRESTPVIIFR